MAKVDPFVIQWPAVWLSDPQIEPVIRYLNRFLHDLWKRTGGGDDLIENNDNESSDFGSGRSQALDDIAAVEQIEDLIPAVIPKVFYPSVKTENYTAVSGDFVDIRSGATITLEPSSEAEIITANGDGTAVKVYSAIPIHYGKSSTKTVILQRQNTTIHWYLFESGTEQFWRAG
jgi:hypothetical protein